MAVTRRAEDYCSRLMILAAVCVVFMILTSSQVFAGKNAGGALIVHTNDAVNFSVGTDYCVAFTPPSSCEEAITRTDKDEDHPAVIWVLAAFDSSSSPAVTAVQFGLHDNLPEGNWEAWGKCGPGVLEIPDDGWPATGKGTALAYSEARTDHLMPIYWMAAYGFAGQDSAYLGTTNYTRGDSLAQFADNSTPPVTDDITHFGNVKWHAAGSNDCPHRNGNDWGSHDDSEDQDAGHGDDAPPVIVDFGRTISAYIDGSALALATREPQPIASVSFYSSDLKNTLLELEATYIWRQFSTGGSTALDNNSQAVRIADVSHSFYIMFPDSATAAAAAESLLTGDHIRGAHVVPPSPVLSTPSDPLYSNWPSCPTPYTNAQWNLSNQASHGPTGHCAHAILGADIGVDNLPQDWPLDPNHSYGSIGILDMGIYDGHPDLRVINGTLGSYDQSMLTPPGLGDFCNDHATKLAGVLGAIDNNNQGIVGVCNGCSLLDIDIAAQGCQSISQDWANNLDDALHLTTLTSPLTALNLSWSYPGYLLDGGALLQTWNAFMENIGVVAASSNVNSTEPSQYWPANVPWIVGVGGLTWDDRFWESNTSCTEDGYGTGVGPGVIDICAPASGSMPTTFTEENPNCPSLHLEYASQSGQCSRAAAEVAGAIAFVQEWAKRDPRTGCRFLDVENVIGAICNSARAFSQLPTDPAIPPSCDGCYYTDYGRGALDVAGAIHLLDDMHDGRIVRRVAGYGEEGVGSFDSTLVAFWQMPDETVWYAFEVTVVVALDDSEGRDVAWPLTRQSNGCFEYADPKWSWMLGEAGVRGFNMEVERGMATFRCYDFAIGQPGGGLWWFDNISPRFIKMPYMTTRPMGGAGVSNAIVNSPGLEVIGTGSPGGGEIRVNYRLKRASTVKCELFDVSGRSIKEVTGGVTAAGAHVVRFGRGDGLSSGIYWLKLTAGSERAVRKMVLLK